MCSAGSASAQPPPPPPPLVRVVPDIPGRGRALVAVRAIKPGEVLLVDSPVLLYPALDVADSSSSSSFSFCAHCYRTLPPRAPEPPNGLAFPCPGCSGHAVFCSDACRTAAAVSSHTPWACQAHSRLRAVAPLPPPLGHPDAFSQAAFLVAAYNLAAVRPDDFLRLLSLQGDASGHTSPEQALALHALVASLSPPSGPAGFSLELTLALLAKDKVNAFGLMQPAAAGAGAPAGERRVRAYGIYPNASLFNHDCLPNACRFDYVDMGSASNTDIIVRAIHDVPEGREVCLSYFPVNWSYKERQRTLLEEYGFACGCDRCVVEKDWKDEDAEAETMDDDEEEVVEDGGGGDEAMEDEEGGDFPHAYFFVRYMCQRENCGGTLAPLPPSQEGVVSDVMECNVCGYLSKGGHAGGGWFEGDD